MDTRAWGAGDGDDGGVRRRRGGAGDTGEDDRALRRVGVAAVGGAGHGGRAQARQHHARRRRRLLARRPGVGGRAQRAGAAVARTAAGGRVACDLQRAHARARVWRCAIRGAPGRHLRLEFRGSEAVRVRRRAGAAGADHRWVLLRAVPGRREAPASAVRARRPHQGRRTAAGVDCRASTRRGRAVGRHRSGVWRGFLLRPDAQPGRLAAGLAAVEPPEHAVGRHRALRRRPRRARPARQAHARRRCG